MEYVKPPDRFAFEEPNAPQRWTRWVKEFENYFVAAELSSKTKEVQVARLLNAAGPEAQEVHDLFTYDANGDEKDYKKVLKKFSDYCRPKKNVIFERHRFWGRSQKDGEAFDWWLKDLRIIAKDCEFQEEDNMVRDKIVYGVLDRKVQERMLRNSELTLQGAIDCCRAAESSKNQLAEIRKGDVTPISEVSSSTAKCFKCNLSGHYARDCTNGEEQHEEKELKCFNCEGFGHMSRVCPTGDGYSQRRRKRSKRGRGGRGGRGRGRGSGRGGRSTSANELEEHEEDEYAQEFAALSLSSLAVSPATQPSEEVSEAPSTEELRAQPIEERPPPPSLCISSLSKSARKRFVKFRFHNLLKGTSNLAELKVDSGAEANVMPLSTYKRLFPERVGADGQPLPRFLRKATRTLEAYGGVRVPHFGTVNVPCEYNGKKFMCRFFLCDIEGSMLVGLPTCEALGIVKISVVDEVSAKDVGEPDDGCIPQAKQGEGYIDSSVPISERPTINGKEDLKRMYPECFETKGKHFLDFEYSIKLDPSVKPQANPPRRVPLELKTHGKTLESLLQSIRAVEVRDVVQLL